MLSIAHAIVLAFVVAACGAEQAPYAPIGWNSYDAFDQDVTEVQYREQLDVLASISQFGWSYGVIDAGWYSPVGNGSAVTSDGYSRLIPDASKFPSSVGNGGFKNLTDYVHGQKMRFGIHVMRGIHRAVVERNEPIVGTNYHAQDIAVANDSCVWWSDWYGVNISHPAAEAYYSSLVSLYSSWGVDFIKVDCIFGGRDGHPEDIKLISQAIAAEDPEMVLSLSPGLGATPEMAAEISPYVNTYRITDDLWDCWSNSSTNSPCPYDHVTVVGAFEKAPQFQQFIGGKGLNGKSWPDLDMLPFGILLHPGTNTPAPSGLTPNEQRSLMTLWSMFKNPLMFGGDLTKLDNFTRSLLTNKEVMDIHRYSFENQALYNTTDLYVWTALTVENRPAYAFFNVANTTVDIEPSFAELNIAGNCLFRDLWAQKNIGFYQNQIKISIQAHDVSFVHVQVCE